MPLGTGCCACCEELLLLWAPLAARGAAPPLPAAAAGVDGVEKGERCSSADAACESAWWTPLEWWSPLLLPHGGVAAEARALALPLGAWAGALLEAQDPPAGRRENGCWLWLRESSKGLLTPPPLPTLLPCVWCAWRLPPGSADSA